MRHLIAYCVFSTVLLSSATVNSAEPIQPVPGQPSANPPLPLPNQPIQGQALPSATQTLRFRNATAGEVSISLWADQKTQPTTIRCAPGGVAAFTLTSDGPFEVTIQTGGQRYSRSRLDLHAVRRRMRGDIASIQAMADLETDIDAVENKKVTTTVGALYVTFPANVRSGVLQALFPAVPLAPAAPANPEQSIPSPPTDIKTPVANPPEARSPQPKTP